MTDFYLEAIKILTIKAFLSLRVDYNPYNKDITFNLRVQSIIILKIRTSEAILSLSTQNHKFEGLFRSLGENVQPVGNDAVAQHRSSFFRTGHKNQLLKLLLCNACWEMSFPIYQYVYTADIVPQMK